MGIATSESKEETEANDQFVQGLSVLDESWTIVGVEDEVAESVRSEEGSVATEVSSLTEDASVSSEIVSPQEQPGESNEVVEEQGQPGDDETKEPPFRPGDHVYRWRDLLGIPRVFQQHGIVIGVKRKTDVDAKETNANSSSENEDFLLTIVDFSNLLDVDTEFDEKAGIWESSRRGRPSHASFFQSHHRSARRCEVYPVGAVPKGGFVRVRTVVANPNDKHPWSKVAYEENGWNMHLLRRSGDRTTARSDEPGMVVARAHFLIEAVLEGLHPSYNAIHASCECAAVWCKTGVWATLQGKRFLGNDSDGSANDVAAEKSSPAGPGIWGLFGGILTVSELSVSPAAIAAAAGGVVTVGGSFALFVIAHKEWLATTNQLNTLFRNSAMQHPESFAKRVNEWNELASYSL